MRTTLPRPSQYCEVIHFQGLELKHYHNIGLFDGFDSLSTMLDRMRLNRVQGRLWYFLERLFPPIS
jgi:hypothetical protein